MTKILQERTFNPFLLMAPKPFSSQNMKGILHVRASLSPGPSILHHFIVPDSDQDIDKLIEKNEREVQQTEATNEGVLSFSFAKIWAADKDSLEEVEDDDQGDSWAQTLQKITAEREKAQIREVTLSGRGVARAARRANAIPKVSTSRNVALPGTLISTLSRAST
jgi:hypothetical protein